MVRAKIWRGALVAALWFVGTNCAFAAEPPTFDEVTEAVSGYFATLRDHQPRDLVSQRDVAGAIDAVRDIGWEVPDADKLISLALADNSFLVKELAKPAGKSFMRKIAVNAGAYSRLDRLSNIANGEDVVRILIRDPGGDTMITYMATTPGGKNLGKMMAGTPNGTDLNKPTGRIYTADDLIAALKKSYAKSFAIASTK